jgi:hypothetical protein
MSEKSPDNSTNKTDANYLKLLQEASRASRLAWLDDKKELGTIATSGLRCLESSKNLNPAGLLQKMSEALLTSKTAWSSKLCALIWKVKVTKHKRLLYQLRASVLPIGEKESGLLPTEKNLWSTPTTFDSNNIQKPRKKHPGGGQVPPLHQQVMWRTPDALSGGSNLPGIKKALDQGHLKRPSGQPIQIRLHDQVREKRLWPTPQKADHLANQSETLKAWKKRAKEKKKEGINLQFALRHAAQMWPTPRASNPGSRPNQKGGKILQEEVLIAEGIRTRGQKLWPTPREFMYKDSKIDRGKSNLGEVVGGTLNPMWVEWLMGYQAGYTDLKDWEILSSRKSQKK